MQTTQQLLICSVNTATHFLLVLMSPSGLKPLKEPRGVAQLTPHSFCRCRQALSLSPWHEPSSGPWKVPTALWALGKPPPPASPAVGPPCSTQLQSRREAGSVINHRKIHGTCSLCTNLRQMRLFTRTQAAFIQPSAHCTSYRRLSHSFPSLQAGGKTATEAKGSWVSLWLLALTHDLALFSHITSPPLVPSRRKGHKAGFDSARELSQRK